MPTTTATFAVKDDNARTLREVPLVLSEVRQTGCATATSTLLTVTDSTVLYPCMQVCCLDVPEGTYIVAIKDTTHVVLSAAAVGTTTGLTAIFKGQNWVAVSKSADRGWWRNLISSGGANLVPLSTNTGLSARTDGFLSDSGLALIPEFELPATSDPNKGLAILKTLTVIADDTMDSSPALRTKTEHWSFWTFVSTGGHVSIVPFDPEHSVCLKELVTTA